MSKTTPAQRKAKKEMREKMQKPTNSQCPNGCPTGCTIECKCPCHAIKASQQDLSNFDNDNDNVQTEDLIKEHIKNETGLTGKWEEVTLACPYCQEQEYSYLFADEKTAYCVACGKEFDYLESPDYSPDLCVTYEGDGQDYLSPEFEQVKKQIETRTVKTLPAHMHKYTPKKSGQIGFTRGKAFCSHAPQQCIAGRNWGVWVGKKDDSKDHAHEFDVVMNLTYGSIKERHHIPISELEKWEDYHASYKEMRMDWPDYGTVHLPLEFWEELASYLRANKAKMLVFCQGGHGRTGTALACLQVVALEWSANQAIRWIRSNYCWKAIESVSQEKYIQAIAAKAEEKRKAQLEPVTV